jgi:ribulose-phosphate 3-epimerase
MANTPVQIVPSVLPADFARLGEDVAALEKAGVDRIQWDVMDGHFVPNLTFGPDVIAACRSHVQVPFEAHLMVTNPDLLLENYVEAGCELVIVHAETCQHLHRTLASIHELGARAGVALNPSTSLEDIRHVIDLTDLVLVMTVNPGFGGQAFIPAMTAKIARIRAMIGDRPIQLEVDGGINSETAAKAAAAGANVLVAGHAVFAGGKYKESIAAIRAAATAAAG